MGDAAGINDFSKMAAATGIMHKKPLTYLQQFPLSRLPYTLDLINRTFSHPLASNRRAPKASKEGSLRENMVKADISA